MKQMPWTTRSFSFDQPAGLFPGILERLRGTPPRIEARLRGLPPELLVRREGDSWSIQENVGHLIEVEGLWRARLDDYFAGCPTLRAADMQNRRTAEAQYNAKSVFEILDAFQTVRGLFVGKLERLDDGMITQAAMHPRLNTRMRVIDMLVFVAEHDDHHLARISELMRDFATGK